MPTISMSKRYRNPVHDYQIGIMDAIDKGEYFRYLSLTYSPKDRTVRMYNNWIVKIDEDGNVKDVNMDMFRRNPTRFLLVRLQMFGIPVHISGGRPMFCGEFIDNTPEEDNV